MVQVVVELGLAGSRSVSLELVFGHTLVVFSCVLVNTAADLPRQYVETECSKKNKHSLLTPLLEFSKRKLPYPMCVVPPITPVDKYDDAKLIG